MRIIKNIIPTLILLALTIYSFQVYQKLSASFLYGLAFLPVLLMVTVSSLSIYFNRSVIFFYVLLVTIVNLTLGLELIKTELGHAVSSALIPIVLLVLTVLPDRGIFSVRAIPAYALLLSAVVITILLMNTLPDGVTAFLLTDWLPERYFDWTPQSQTILFISAAGFISMLVLYCLQPSPHMSAGLGVLIILIVQLHFTGTDRSLNVLSSSALLMCMYAVLQESWRMAYLDELTELPGRRALREKFQKMGGLYTVAMLDVDHFKKFNDTYGHDTGDAVLRMIATKMNKVSGSGLSYRYGGEEFTIVFNGRSKEDAITHLETLRETIADTPFVINRASRRKSDKKIKHTKNRSVTVTVSIGVADSKSSVASPWDTLKLSDKALYRAKGKGRNCVSV